MFRPLVITFVLTFALFGASYGVHSFQAASHVCDQGCKF